MKPSSLHLDERGWASCPVRRTEGERKWPPAKGKGDNVNIEGETVLSRAVSRCVPLLPKEKKGKGGKKGEKNPLDRTRKEVVSNFGEGKKDPSRRPSLSRGKTDRLERTHKRAGGGGNFPGKEGDTSSRRKVSYFLQKRGGCCLPLGSLEVEILARSRRKSIISRSEKRAIPTDEKRKVTSHS